MYEVDTLSLVRLAQSLDDCGSGLSDLDNKLRQIASESIISGSTYTAVVKAMSSVARRYDAEFAHAHSLADVVRNVSTLYTSTERDVVNQGKSKFGDSSAKSEGQFNGSSSSRSFATDEEHPSLADDFKELKDWAKLIDEGKLAGSENGYAAAFFSYLSSLAKFFDKDSWDKEGGGKLLLDLCRDSIAGWKKLYDGYMKLFGAQGFDGYGLFSYTGQKGVAGLGVLSSGLGVISTFMGLQNGGFQNPLDAVTQYVEKGGKSIAGFGKSIYDAKNVYALVAGGSKTAYAAGSVNGLAVMALINGGIGIFTQSAKSFDKYVLADGNCTFDDINQFFIDVSVSGLYYGAGGGLIEGVSGYSGEDASEGLKARVRDVVKGLRNS